MAFSLQFAAICPIFPRINTVLICSLYTVAATAASAGVSTASVLGKQPPPQPQPRGRLPSYQRTWHFHGSSQRYVLPFHRNNTVLVCSLYTVAATAAAAGTLTASVVGVGARAAEVDLVFRSPSISRQTVICEVPDLITGMAPPWG